MKNSFIFDEIKPFGNDYACVQINNQYGAIDKNGKWIIKPKFDYLRSITPNLFIAKQDNKYGVIDKDEKFVIPAEFDNLIGFKYEVYDDYLISVKNNKFGIINLHGECIVPYEYEYISKNSTLYFTAIKDAKFGCFDINNKVIIPFEYDTELQLGKDFVICGKHKCIYEHNEIQKYIMYGVTDYKGNTIIPFEYINFEPLADNNIAEISLSDLTFSAKKIDSKNIIIDKNNKNICKYEFDYILADSTKLYSAKIDSKLCAIDKFGNIKFSSDKYKIIYGFKDINENVYVAIAVNENNEEALIDQNGEIIIPYEAGYKTNGFMYTRQNTILMQKDNKFGVIDSDNNVIIPFIYDWIYYESKGKFSGANIGDKWGYIDCNGQPLTIEPLHTNNVDNGQLSLI